MVVIQEDDAVHACAFDTFMRPSPAAFSPRAAPRIIVMAQATAIQKHGPDPVRTSPAALTSTAARFSANITAWIIV